MDYESNRIETSTLYLQGYSLPYGVHKSRQQVDFLEIVFHNFFCSSEIPEFQLSSLFRAEHQQI